MLRFSIVFLSLLLFIAVGTLGILTLSKPQIASASNTYTETWTATSGIYSTGGSSSAPGTYTVGIPATGTACAQYIYLSNGVSISFVATVTAWSVSGTIN